MLTLVRETHMPVRSLHKHACHTCQAQEELCHADVDIRVGLQITLALASSPQQAQALAHEKLLRAQRQPCCGPEASSQTGSQASSRQQPPGQV